MMEVHVCNRAGKTLRAYALGDRNEIIIGRDSHCDIRIDAPSVSAEHCSIERDGPGMTLRDLNSAGGTFIKGRRLTKVRLTDGLQVEVGPAVLKFCDSDL